MAMTLAAEVPDVMFEGRRIALEAKSMRDMPLAQKHAKVLSNILKERLLAKSASDSPTAMPIIIPGGNGD